MKPASYLTRQPAKCNISRVNMKWICWSKLAVCYSAFEENGIRKIILYIFFCSLLFSFLFPFNNLVFSWYYELDYYFKLVEMGKVRQLNFALRHEFQTNLLFCSQKKPNQIPQPKTNDQIFNWQITKKTCDLFQCVSFTSLWLICGGLFYISSR